MLLLPLLAKNMIHLSIASAIPGDVNAPIDILGVHTNLGTALIGFFFVAMILMGFAFSPSGSKTHASAGMGYTVFFVFLVGILAIGYMAR
jgi:uncharacterized PurR-regulated membrane protein YhhQ (DUF165 family)